MTYTETRTIAVVGSVEDLLEAFAMNVKELAQDMEYVRALLYENAPKHIREEYCENCVFKEMEHSTAIDILQTEYQDGIGRLVRAYLETQDENYTTVATSGGNCRIIQLPAIPDEDIVEQIADVVEEINNNVAFIRENRPDDPENVSYGLDDLQKQVDEIQQATEQTEYDTPPQVTTNSEDPEEA